MRMLQCIGNWESHQVGRAHGERICEDFEEKKKKKFKQSTEKTLLLFTINLIK